MGEIVIIMGLDICLYKIINRDNKSDIHKPIVIDGELSLHNNIKDNIETVCLEYSPSNENVVWCDPVPVSYMGRGVVDEFYELLHNSIKTEISSKKDIEHILNYVIEERKKYFKENFIDNFVDFIHFMEASLLWWSACFSFDETLHCI